MEKVQSAGGEKGSFQKDGNVKEAKDKSQCNVKNAKLDNQPLESEVIDRRTDPSDNCEEDFLCQRPVYKASEPGQKNQDTDADGNHTKSPFLFIGPVGKKRFHCRRRTPGDAEAEATSPIAVPTSDLSSIEHDPPCLFIEDTSEDSSRSRGSAASGQDAEPAITSTPTSVIRSTIGRRREEQPLNLSLPLDNQQPSCSKNKRDAVGERISVISIVSREILEDSQSPSEYAQSREESGYEDGNATPSHSMSNDLFAISSGSVLNSSGFSPGAPSSFQGLLMGHGQAVVQQGMGSPALKKKLRCRDCGKEFSQLRNYKYHRSRHEGTQQFACTCPVCGKTFNDKGYLSSHLKIHRNEKEYKCEWCGKSFNQRVAYNMHIRIHTGHKPHKCSYCPKAFSRKMLLRQHIRTHTGERPYKCSICGKAFADRSNMLLHQRLHSGERPYKCHICGKSFSKNHHLKTHLNHHAGIKPYQCEKCNACFSQSSNMKTHFRKCTGIPNATSTITSGAFETPTPGTTRNISSTHNIPLLSQNLSPFSISEMHDVALIEEQMQHQQQIQQQQLRLRQMQHEQFVGLSTTQQQQLLEEVSATLGLSPPPVPSPLPSPTSRSGYRSSVSQSPSQSLGFSLSSMSLTGAQGVSPRSRRQSGLSHLTLSNPSPTSLAAGHPFIPLNALENASLAAGQTNSLHLSPSSSISVSTNHMLMSPRNHNSSFGELSPSEFSQIHSLTQTIAQQRRSRMQQSFEQNQNEIHANNMARRLQQHQLSPHQNSHISPNRQPLSPRPSHAQVSQQEYYDVVLPAFSLSRSSMSHNQLSPRQSQQIREEMIMEAQQHLARPQDLQRIYRVQNPNSRSHTQLQGSHHQQHQGLLLTVSEEAASSSARPLPSISSLTNAAAIPNSSSQSHSDILRDSLSTSLEQRLRAQSQQSWRARELGNENSKSSLKDGQYRN